MRKERNSVRRVKVDRGWRNWFIVNRLGLSWNKSIGNSCGQVLELILVILHGTESARQNIIILLSLGIADELEPFFDAAANRYARLYADVSRQQGPWVEPGGPFCRDVRGQAAVPHHAARVVRRRQAPGPGRGV